MFHSKHLTVNKILISPCNDTADGIRKGNALVCMFISIKMLNKNVQFYCIRQISLLFIKKSFD